jgi:hypothetical protein
MSAKKPKMFNRLGGMLDEGVSKLQDAAGDWGDKFRSDAQTVSKKAKKSWQRGKRQIMPDPWWVRAVRDHPALWILAAVTLVLLIVSKVVLDQEDELPWDEV